MDQKVGYGDFCQLKSLRKDTRNYFIEVLSQANCITFVSARRKIGVRQWRGRLQFRKKNIYEEKKQHLDTVYYRTDLFLLSTRQR